MSHIAATQWTATRGRLLLVATVDPREIGRRIKLAREKKTWTQLTFALEANVSPSTITRWESGKLPPIRELIRVAGLLGVEPDYLVETDDDDDSDATGLAGESVAELRREVARLRAENEQAQAETQEKLAAILSLLEQRRSA